MALTMPDFLRQRPAPSASAAMESLAVLGIAHEQIECVPVSKLEAFRGEIVGQVPHPAESISSRTEVTLFVARDNTADRLPHGFLEPLPTAEDEAHVSIEPGQVMEYWERETSAYGPGRSFIVMLDRAFSRLDSAISRIGRTMGASSTDPSYAEYILDQMGYGGLPLADHEKMYFAARMQRLCGQCGPITGMTLLLEALLGVRVNIVEVDGEPLRLPQELTGTLGKSRIGENCALGASFQDPTPKLEIQLGPVSAHEHAALDGDAAWWNRANALANAFAPASVSWDYRLLLADSDKSLVLGDPLLARLGRSSYLPA